VKTSYTKKEENISPPLPLPSSQQSFKELLRIFDLTPSFSYINLLDKLMKKEVGTNAEPIR